MEIEYHQKHSDLFDKHFHSDLDEQALILKGHLLLEGMLRDYCLSVVHHPASLREARLSFNQVTLLARSLIALPVQDFEWVWGVLGKINKMRNMLAHELEPNQDLLKATRDSIVNTVYSARLDRPDSASLSGALSYLSGCMVAMLHLSVCAVKFVDAGEELND